MKQIIIRSLLIVLAVSPFAMCGAFTLLCLSGAIRGLLSLTFDITGILIGLGFVSCWLIYGNFIKETYTLYNNLKK